MDRATLTAILATAALVAACKTPSKAEPGGGAPGSGDSAATPPAVGATPVAVADLLKDYKDNEVRADGKYKGKRLRVTGKVGEIKKDITDSIYVTVGTGGEFELPEAQCFFGDEHAKEAAALSKGAKVTVDCVCEGLMMNVLMKDCAFAAPGGATAPTVKDGKSSLDVCHKLEAAGVAAKCRAGTAGESSQFDIASLPGKTGSVVRLPDDAMYGKYLAGATASPATSPLRPFFGSSSARAVVHLSRGVSPDTEKKTKATVDAI